MDIKQPQLQITHQQPTNENGGNIIDGKAYRYFLLCDGEQIEINLNTNNRFINFSQIINELPKDNYDENLSILIEHISLTTDGELDIDTKDLLQPNNVVWEIGKWVSDFGMIPNYHIELEDGEYEFKTDNYDVKGVINVENKVIQIWELDGYFTSDEDEDTIYIEDVVINNNQLTLITNQ